MPTNAPWLRPPTRSRRARWVVGVAAALAVLVQLLSLYWPVVSVDGPVSWTDKVVHLLLFAVPTYAVALATARIVPVAVVFAVHAPVSELVQHFLLPHRSGDVWDAVLDLLGVGVGLLLWQAHKARATRRRGRPRT